jgi:lauroyl/myristoyl acyltransferase
MGILPVFALREHGINRLLVERPITPRNKGNADADLDATASAWLKVVERMVRRYPAHYLAFLFTRFRQRTQDPVPLFGDEG